MRWLGGPPAPDRRPPSAGAGLLLGARPLRGSGALHRPHPTPFRVGGFRATLGAEPADVPCRRGTTAARSAPVGRERPFRPGGAAPWTTTPSCVHWARSCSVTTPGW